MPTRRLTIRNRRMERRNRARILTWMARATPRTDAHSDQFHVRRGDQPIERLGGNPPQQHPVVALNGEGVDGGRYAVVAEVAAEAFGVVLRIDLAEQNAVGSDCSVQLNRHRME